MNTSIAACNYCGEWSDSPATEADVRNEFDRLKAYLASHGIKNLRLRRGDQVGNFAVRILLTARSKDVAAAKSLAGAWIAEHRHDTRLIYTL